MTHSSRWFILGISVLAPVATAQQRSDDSRYPRFLVESAGARVPADLSRSPSLSRPVTVSLSNVKFRDAIAELSRQSGIAIVYGKDDLRSDDRVSVQARAASVASVFSDILVNKGLDVLLQANGSAAALVARESPAPILGSITGKVVDAGRLPLAAVTISVEGTTFGAITRDDGTYRIAGVPDGQRVLVARRVGYTSQRRTVAVAGADMTVDFELTPTAMSLEGIVSTATGQQRKIELGNSVASIDVATLKETQPIKSMSDLLTAQATGVVTLPGTVPGTAPRIRIRGQNSLSVSNDPIYIIDGVRMAAAASGPPTNDNVGAGSTQASRLQDLNPEEIENIEIVKGPSAATLYGTDAANGVIVITTRRGKAGPARWSVHAERGQNQDDNNYIKSYALIGYSAGDRLQTPRRCRLYEVYNYDTLTKRVAPQCVLTSENVLDLARGDSTTWLIAAPRTNIGGQVSGGTNELRFFISADGSAEYGPYGLTKIDKKIFDSTRSQIRDEMDRPSYINQIATRANLNATIGQKLDVGLSSGLTLMDQRFPLTGNSAGPMQQVTFGLGCLYCPGSSDNAIARGGFGSGSTPGRASRAVATQNVDRFIGSVTANYRPLSWLTGSGDIGLDLAQERNVQLDRPGDQAAASTVGNALDERVGRTTFTTNLRGTATWQATKWAQLRSTGGWQFVATDVSSVDARGTDLGVGGEVPSQGVNKFITTSSRPIRTMGVYIDEQLGLRDRLYLTAAVRTDQASAFGSGFQHAYYPKASASWIISDEGFFPRVPFMSQLRLRAAEGTSGVQPGLTEALTTYNASSVYYRGVTTNGLALATTGNPALKPERSQELETGFDSRWFGGRVNAEFTFYNKKTKDALFTQPTATSAGVPGYRTNLGGMQNKGVEYRLNAQVVDTRNYGIDVMFSGSNNQNRILDLGPVTQTNPFAANQAGLPVNSIFQRKLTWKDINGDGWLGAQEINGAWPTDSTRYLGPNLDPVQMTLAIGAEFIQHRLRFQASFDRKAGGFRLNQNIQTVNSPGSFPGGIGTNCSCAHGDLFEQARATSTFLNGTGSGGGDAFIESTAFTRLREVSLSYDLGSRFAGRYLGAKSARISVAGRNIAMWADHWSVGDPEEVNGDGASVVDSRWSYGPVSYYMLRFNLVY